MATTLFVSLVCLALGFAAGRWRRAFVENRGEATVRRELSVAFATDEYHLLNNVTLPTTDGTTQVDHILISRYGVFVIETKHYKGWLFANATAPQWTQVLYKKNYKFQNPLHQNHKHVSIVAELLDFIPRDQIHSLVVFTGDAVFKTERPAGVVYLSELRSYIDSYKLQVISANRMQFCVGRLECRRRALTRQTDVEHIAHLRRKFGDAT